MKFSVDKRDKYCIFKLDEDRLNSILSANLKSELVVLNAEGFRNIVLDMTGVQFVDSSGLSSILVGNRLCKDSGGSFVLAAVHPTVQRLLRISQLDSVLSLIPTVEEASDFIMMEELERDLSGKE